MNFLLKLFFALFILGVHGTANGQQYNRPVPDDLFPYEYANAGFNGSGYFFATPAKLNVFPSNPNYKSPYPVIFDSDGYIAWYAKPNTGSCLDFKYYENVDLYTLTYVKQGNPGFLIMDGGLNPVDTLFVVDHSHDVHDIQLAANGNWLLGTAFFDTVDLSAYTFNGTQGSATTIIKGFGYQEFDAADNLVGEWNSNDFISPTETYDFWGYAPNVFDYCHGNAIEEDTDGNLLMSFRHLNSIYKIDRVTGAIIWRLGGNSSDFTFTNDSGFSGQHDVRRLSNGNYSLFDNGNMATTQLSRGVEYTLDTVNWTATKSVEYIHPTNVYSRGMGSYQTTSDGHKVLGYGRVLQPHPVATIIDGTQSILSQFFFEDSVVSYRFHYFEIPNLVRPEISCVQTQNGFELTVENASDYVWSTGETTQSISLNNAGTYQVWIPYNFGYIGSEPFIVTDTINPCGNAGVGNLSAEDGAFEYYDLLGRKVDYPEANKVYLKVWSTGKTEKTMFTE